MIRAILFDLGKVLLEFDHMEICRGFSRISGHAPDRVYERLFESGLEEAFDLGGITPEVFSERIGEALGIRPDPESFRPIWADIFQPIARMESLVRSLATCYKLVLVSNTNEWHFEHCRSNYSWLECFHHHVLSYKLGVKKPDPTVFERALFQAGVAPEEAVFIDDIAKYTDAAALMGIKSICFKDSDQLKSELSALGVVPA